MDRFITLQFILILLSIPLQLFIVTKWSYKNTESTETLQKIINHLNGLFDYLSPNSWFKWYISFVIDIPVSFNEKLHKQTWKHDIQSPAVEVFHFREKYGYFATSPTIRSPRSEHIKYRIGQVIRHKIHGYRAVIIGWDETVRAPEQWLKEHLKYIRQPHYSVLLDTRDQRVHKTYIPEEHIEVLINTKIINAQLTDYFTVFDGSQYMMKLWLREQYPHD